MSTGILQPTSVDLSTRVVLDGTNADTLELIGNGGSDVNVTGVKDCIVSGEFTTTSLSLLGGKAIMIWGAQIGAMTTGSTIIYGGFNVAASVQPPQPQAGRVVGITASNSVSSTVTWTLYVNGVASALALSISAATKGRVEGTIPFSSGDRLWIQITSGTANNAKAAFFIIYD